MSSVKLKRWHQFALAGLVLTVLYGIHFLCCARSPLIQIRYLNQQTDMYANLLWAKSILDQGWLNPQPYHPFAAWMEPIGTRNQWIQWWGGGAIFQQSPLYVYLLSGLLWLNDNLFYVYLLQTVLAMAFCGLIGLIAHRVSGDRRVGWMAFILAALYSPFYACSWPLLRDVLGWTITAVALLLLLEWDRCEGDRGKQNWLAGAIGLTLGIGYLARETFLLIIPLVGLMLVISAVRRRYCRPVICLVCGVLVALAPLVVRNARVGAPLLSSSNRFAEAFISGNVCGTSPNEFVVVIGSYRRILERSGGKTIPLVVETIRTHPDAWSFIRLECLKAASLLDPYEPSDNLNYYFLENISPPVRWGLRHWMIIIPGLGGLALTLRSKDGRHFWLWLLFLPLAAGVIVGTPMSRYRQTLALCWIPWAACFLVAMWTDWPRNRRRVGVMAGALVLGWTACLTVFNRTPRSEYERPGEYETMILFYEQEGLPDQAERWKELFHEKFPGLNPGPAAPLH